MINKNVQVWRGFNTPPTNYHIWYKNGAFYTYDGEDWIPSAGGQGSGITTVETEADLPEDSPVGTLATVNKQVTEQYHVINEFKVSDSFLTNENPIPIKRFNTKSQYDYPVNMDGCYIFTGISDSLFSELIFDCYWEDGFPYIYVNAYVEHVTGQNFQFSNNLTYPDYETGEVRLDTESLMVIPGFLNIMDLFSYGKYNYYIDELEDLNADDVKFLGQFFDYNDSYSYTKTSDVNDIFFKEFEGWKLRNGVEILSNEDQLQENAPAGTIASVAYDSREEKISKASELKCLNINLNGILGVEEGEITPDTIGNLINDLLEVILDFIKQLVRIKRIELNFPYTNLNQIPQALKSGKEIQCVLVPKHTNLMNLYEIPTLYMYGDEYEFVFGNINDSDAIIWTDYDTGEVHFDKRRLAALNMHLSHETHYWTGCFYYDEDGKKIDASRLFDSFVTLLTTQGDTATDFYVKDSEKWNKVISSTNDKVNGLFANPESVKFKGYVNVDTIDAVDDLFDSLQVNEMAFAVPSTALLGAFTGASALPLMKDSFVPWAVSGYPDINSHIEMSSELFNIGICFGEKHGFEVRTYFILDKDNPRIKCPDMLMVAKVELNLRELLSDLITSQLGIFINIPETIVISVGKILRWGSGGAGGSGAFPHLDNSLDVCTLHTTGVQDWTREFSSSTPGGYYSSDFTVYTTSTPETDHNGYYSVQQFAYGRNGSADGRVWTRTFFIREDGIATRYPWVEVGGGSSEISSLKSTLNTLNNTTIPSIRNSVTTVSSDLSTHITNASKNIPALTHTKYGYGYDMDAAVETGIIKYTPVSSKGYYPGGLKENFTVIVFASYDLDPDYYTIQQFAYGRSGEASDRVWTRVFFKHKSSSSKDDFKPWVEITGSGSSVPIVNDSNALKEDASIGTLATVVVNDVPTLYVKKSNGWEEYRNESDPEDVDDILSIL